MKKGGGRERKKKSALVEHQWKGEITAKWDTKGGCDINGIII